LKSVITIKDKKFKRFITAVEIQSRVEEIAETLSKEFHDKHPVFIVILRGAFMFAGDILKHFNDPCEIEFTKLASYDGMESSGKIQMLLPVKDEVIRGRDIIIIEDIVDSGLTMHYFMNFLKALHPKSVTLVTLLTKPENLEKEVTVNHVGFIIPNLFVVGYGLDYDGEGRNLDAIYQVEED
jgi:hypoxanthine phosphoribosyltransferase